MTDKQIGVGGPRPPGQDVSNAGCQILVWEQAGMSEGNLEGHPVGD